jgi:hypothetical protein
MNKIKLLAAALFAAPLLFAGSALAAEPDIQNSLCGGTSLSTKSTTCAESTTAANTTIDGIIATVINLFSLVVGVVAVIMIIIGGLKYITSGGDSGNVTGAKNTILYAVIGLVVVALAQIIVRFVLNRATTV